MMIGISSEILTFKPTLVLIYGDTNSTLSGALAASKNEIPIVHIEGGVRNFDMKIPEEVNRVVSDRLSDIIFCSSNKSLENLKNEGFNNFETDIVKTDDLLTDSVFQLIKDIRRNNIFKDTFSHIIPNKYVLLTIHRKLSLSEECLFDVFGAINELAKDYNFVFPMHPNTSNRLQEKKIKLSEKISCISPQNYENMLALIDNCFAVITDSGGVQREAYLLKKKSLLVLGYTPWEELVHNQCASVCNVNKASVISGWRKMLHLSPSFDTQLYGNGNGAKQIIDKIIKKFS